MSMTDEAGDVDATASSSAAVQHLSSSDLESCNECKPEQSPAEVFCSACEVSLCKLCDSDIVHKSKTTSTHQRMKIEEYLLVERGIGGSSPTEDQVQADRQNTLCCINPIDHHIIVQPRLLSLVPEPNALPSLVAFVGPTGAGKSTLLRILTTLNGERRDEVDMPLAGAPKDSLSTSTDLQMYGGGQVPTDSRAQSDSDLAYPLLYVDSEGQGGLKEPHAVGRMFKTFKNVLQGKIGTFEEYRNCRITHVQHSYPRLLYIFSDVLCFTFTGDWREQESILKPLKEWAKSAALGAVNQHRPQLFLIFNKRGKEASEPEYDDFRQTFLTWIQGVEDGSSEKLACYYLDPEICLIPERALDPITVLSRVKKLHEKIIGATNHIRTSREQTNQLFTRRQLQHYMQLAAHSFSKNPTCKFDIYRESMALRPTSVGLAKFIVEFRRAAEQASLACTKKQRHVESLSILRKRFPCSVLLWVGRLKLNVLLGPNATLPLDLETDLEKAQRGIDGDLPCAAIKVVDHHTHQCDTVQCMHRDVLSHASADGRAGKAERWFGRFILHPEVEAAQKDCNLGDLAINALRNTTTEVLKTIRERLFKMHQSERVRYPWSQSFMSYQVCVSCILELPTEVLSCGHIICAKCAKEVVEIRSLEKKCPICLCPAQWYPKDLPRLAGYRILSLDGGGVRGIVELLSLKVIMSFFPGMHVEDLFDIIAGTSTGGIIALALTTHKLNEQPKRLGDVINLFEDLSKSIFSHQMLRVGANVTFFRWFFQLCGVYDTKYKNDNLLELLKEHFGEQALLSSCVGGPRVIVTSCARDVNYDAVWFTSYNRPMLENECNNLFQESTEQSTREVVSGRVPDNHIFSAKDAAAATSAASTYFPSYEAGKRFWVDGGIRYNCPAKVAIQEARILWPHHEASALISLGCGHFPSDEESQSSDSVISVVTNLAKAILDAESQSRDALKRLQELQPDSSRCGIRLNPTFKVSKGETYDLDHAMKIPALKEMTETYLRGDGRACVEEAANLLWAAQFYLEVELDEVLEDKKLDTLCIRSRAALPSHFQRALDFANRSGTPPFSGTVLDAPDAIFEFSWDKVTWNQGVMNLPFTLAGYPRIRSVIVTVNLHMCLPETSAPKGWSLPISGMPCKLIITDWQ